MAGWAWALASSARFSTGFILIIIVDPEIIYPKN